jgi:hypothetical protein
MEDVNITPEELHKRATSLAHKQRDLQILISAGCIALYFNLLTQKISPTLTPYETVSIIFALLGMSLCMLSGILSIHADARRNWYWAMLLKCEESESKDTYKSKRSFWRRFHMKTQEGMTIGLFFGVIFSVQFIILRVL